MTTPHGHARHLMESVGASSDLEAELLAAERDFENGDFVELTVEQLDRCIETGESPWPGESSV
jgi:hypothetical protein